MRTNTLKCSRKTHPSRGKADMWAIWLSIVTSALILVIIVTTLIDMVKTDKEYKRAVTELNHAEYRRIQRITQGW